MPLNMYNYHIIKLLSVDCSVGKYGPGCLLTCNCETDCHKITGDCLVKCAPGWKGPDCLQRKYQTFKL